MPEKVVKEFGELKVGDKFFHERQLCIKTSDTTFHVWSTGERWWTNDILQVRPVKVQVKVEFYYKKGKKR